MSLLSNHTIIPGLLSGHSNGLPRPGFASATAGFRAGTIGTYYNEIVGALGGVAGGYDVVLLAGQSNMAGRGTFNVGIDTADANVLQFDGYSASGTYRTIIAGLDPMKHPEMGVLSTAVGPGMFFGKRYNALTGRKVLLVPAAWGGTSLVAGTLTWNPTGRDYLNAIDQANRAVTAAVAAIPGSRFVGTLWIQGEGDGSNSVSQAAYEAAFVPLIAGLRAGITGASNSWFVVGQMMPEAISTNGGGSGTYSAIDAAHTAVAAAVFGCTKVAIGTGFNSGDNLHYNAAGERLMGTTMADGVSTAQANTGDAQPGQVTGLTAGTATASGIPISWTAPSGTVRDYEIQYSLAGSGSWTTLPDGVSTATSATVSGLSASTSYDIRVRATNYGATPGAYSSTLTASTIAAGLTDAFVRLTSITGAKITESGSAGAGWSYTGLATSSTFATDHAGTSDIKMPSGVDGDLRAKFDTSVLGGVQTVILGIVLSQTDPAYSAGASGYKFGLLTHSSGSYRVIVDGGASAVVGNGTSTTIADLDNLRLSRSGGTWVAQVSRTATPTTWITIHTFAATHSGDCWAALSYQVGASGAPVTGPLIGAGWA